jgi:hypothetical protein
MFFSLPEINPKWRILFSSRLVMLDHFQSHWGPLAAASAAVEDLNATAAGFDAAALEEVSTLFFPISSEDAFLTAPRALVWWKWSEVGRKEMKIMSGEVTNRPPPSVYKEL